MRLLATFALLAAAAACFAQTAAPVPMTKPTLVQAVTRAAGLEARIMWMDATANLDNLDTRAKVANVMERCRRANINTVVVDVKPLIGEVLYPSKVATRLFTYRGKDYDPSYDLLATALEEGRRRGLKVYANINVFSEGHKLVGRGPAYEKTDWQAVTYIPDRSIATEEGSYALWPIIGEAPPADAMSVHTPGAGPAKNVRPGDTYSIVADNVVIATVAGNAIAETTVPIPPNGFTLAGTGAASQWMFERLRPGTRVRWQMTDRLVPILHAPTERISVFVNPIHPEVRERELAIIREIASNYDLDGIVFDRMRYSSLASDFSERSRHAFEKWAGVTIRNWPDDIYQHAADPTQETIRGPYFKLWLEWRAHVIREFAQEATRVARAARPGIKCAAYVGSWYSVYYGVGVNWASDEFNAQYDWMTDTYHRTGYAPMMDWICTGTYYGEPYRAGAEKAGRDPDATVEAAAALSTRVVSDAAFVYASLNIPDYTNRSGPLLQAIQAGTQETQGIMLFDMVHIINANLWGVVEQAFPQPAVAPHDVPELLEKIRDVRAVIPAVPARQPLADNQNWRLVVPE